MGRTQQATVHIEDFGTVQMRHVAQVACAKTVSLRHASCSKDQNLLAL